MLDLFTLIDRVLREQKFRQRLNTLSFIDDARQELRIHFTLHPEKLGPSEAYASQSIRNKLRDILKEESTRQLPLDYSFDGDNVVSHSRDYEDKYDAINPYKHEPFSELRSKRREVIIAELQQRPDYQQLLQAYEANTLAAKSAAMGCKLADVRQRMNKAGQLIDNFIRERMGRLAD
jgi:hypothetical protein